MLGSDFEVEPARIAARALSTKISSGREDLLHRSKASEKLMKTPRTR